MSFYFQSKFLGHRISVTPQRTYVAKGGRIAVDNPDHKDLIEGMAIFGRDIWRVNEHGVAIDSDTGAVIDSTRDDIVRIVMDDGSIRDMTVAQLAECVSIVETAQAGEEESDEFGSADDDAPGDAEIDAVLEADPPSVAGITVDRLPENGPELRALRLSKGITMARLAGILGVSTGTITRAERAEEGRFPPSVQGALHKLATVDWQSVVAGKAN